MAWEGAPVRGEGLEFGPAPASFDQSSVDLAGRDARARASHGICVWLTAAQADLTGATPVHTNRLVRQVTSSDGLQAAARFDVSFNPQHQRVVIHGVRVIRDGVMRDEGRSEAFELLRRELNLERAVYDGRVTAHMVIPDIREGDVVDTSYSVIGVNPALRGRFAWWFCLQWTAPVWETRCRIRIAPDRPLEFRKFGIAPEPDDTVADGIRSLTWRMIDAPTYLSQQGAPAWWTGFAAVQVTDRLTWAEVADIFRQGYEPPTELPEELAEGVRRIAAQEPRPADRAAEGLRLVQRALRYHSVGVGEGGFRPRPLADIWRTRYGDCKDGSLLLTAVLRALGLDAVCALVNTVGGEDLAETPPNAVAFDHCIVRVRLDGASYWLDGTASPQAGRLEHLSQAAFSWALPLVPDATLERMPPAPLATLCETTETWTFSKYAARPAQLEMRTLYRQWRADSMRRWVASDGAEGLAKQLREGLEQDCRSPMQTLKPLELIDDAEINTLELVETYEVERPFQQADKGKGLMFLSRDDVVGPHLTSWSTERRIEPIALGAPRRIETTRIFRFPVEMQITPWNETHQGPVGLEGHSRFVWRTPKEGVQTVSLTVAEPMVPARRANDYADFVETMRGLNGIRFAVPVSGLKIKSARGGDGQAAWIWLVIFAAIYACWRLLGNQ